VEERYLAVSEELRVLDRLHDEEHHLLHLAVLEDGAVGAEGESVLVNDTSVAKPLVAVSEEGDVDEEVGQLDLPILLVPSLNRLDGHVGVFLGVVEGEE